MVGLKKRKTTIKKQGRGFSISFSEKDGKDLAKRVRNGGSLMGELKPGQSCGHPGCLHHVTHPCERCGRTHRG